MDDLVCLVCGGSHEPHPRVCDLDEMERRAASMGCQRMNRLTGIVANKLNQRIKQPNT